MAEHVGQMPPPATPRQMRSIVSGLRCIEFQQQRRDEHRRMLKGEFRSSQSPEKLWQALPDSGVKVGQIDRQRRRRNPLLHPQPLRRDAHHLRQPRHSASTQHPGPDRLARGVQWRYLPGQRDQLWRRRKERETMRTRLACRVLSGQQPSPFFSGHRSVARAEHGMQSFLGTLLINVFLSIEHVNV